jgi:predicted GTPase
MTGWNAIFAATECGELCDWADKLSSVMKSRGRADIVQQIDEAKKQLAANTFTIAVVGKAKRGKSTLINAMLGRTDDMVAPIDKLPASSAITRFRNGVEKTTVLYQDGSAENVPYSRIREFVTEEGNPNNRKNVAMLEVEGEFPHLPRQVEIVDTPGAGSIHEHHDALLHGFIPSADAVIFVLTARMPLDQDELNLLKEIKAADIKKIFFVLNKIDESEPQDIEDAIAHNEKLLRSIGLSIGTFHRVSARNAFLGKSDSHVPALLEDIGQFCNNNKGKVLRQRFLIRVNGAIETEARGVEVAISSATKTNEELDREIANLQLQRQESTRTSEFTEKEFLRKWESAVGAFSSALLGAESKVRNSVAERINATSAMGIGKLVKELPTFLNVQLEEHLNPIAGDFEAKAKSLCEELNAEFPKLSINDDTSVPIKLRSDMAGGRGVVGGGVLAAGGYGLATAGASAAASIAASNAAALAAYSAATGSAATSASLLGLAGMAIDAVAIGVLGTPLGLSAAGAAAAAPVAAPALVSTPLWVALSGPVGWTLAGIGALAVPYYWRLSKLKQKDRIDAETEKQVEQLFKGIRNSRIPALKEAGTSIVGGYRNRLEYQIKQLEDAFASAKANRPDESGLAVLRTQSDSLKQLIAQGEALFHACG